MNNLDQLPFETKKKVNPKVLKAIILVMVVCGVANTYVMGILWYKRGFHLSYVVTGGIMLILVAFALWNWPEKPSKYYDWEPEYQEPEIEFNPDQHI